MAKKRSGTSLESEHHIVGIRMRVIGAGMLEMFLTDLNDTQTQTLVPFDMQASTRFEPLRLANFQSQRTRLVGLVNQIDENFIVKRIIFYAKPVAIEYPSNVTLGAQGAGIVT